MKTSSFSLAGTFRVPQLAVAALPLFAAFGTCVFSGCVGERPPQGTPQQIDVPDVEARCQGDSTVLQGDVYVRSETDLVVFGGCRQIVGNVVVENATGLEDLGPLSSIEAIDGFLYVGNNPDLTSIAALSQVTRIGRGVLIEGNAQLVAAEFDVLTEAAGNIVIEDNPELIRVGFPLVEIIEPALVDIDGQGTLAPQGGALVLANNPLIERLEFGSLLEIDGDLDIRGLDSIAALLGFEALTEITGTLSFGVTTDDRGDVLPVPNLILASLEGLASLETIGGDLVLGFFPVLASLDGLAQVEEVGGDLVVFGNSALSTLGGLSALESIGGDVNIGQSVDFEDNLVPFGNTVLRTIDLDTLESIGGDLIAVGNPALQTLSDMEALTSLGGDVVLGGNAALENIELPPLLLALPGDLNLGVFGQPDGQVLVLENGTTAFGTPLYTTIEGNVLLGGQTPSDLSAFAAVTRIGGRLSLIATTLESTTGLTALTELGALEIGIAREFVDAAGLQVAFTGNADLERVEGFDALATLGALQIVEAPALETLTLPAIGVGGEVVLTGLAALDPITIAAPTVGADLVVGSIELPSGRTVSAGPMGAEAIAAPALTAVGGDVVVQEAALLTTLSAPVLASVGGDLRLDSLPALTSVTCAALTEVSGDLALANDAALTTFDQGVAIVGGDMTILGAPQLALAFSALTEVGGTLEISATEAAAADFTLLNRIGAEWRMTGATTLQTLDGFANVTEIGGDLTLENNTVLEGAAGLVALTRVEGALVARENPAFDETTLATLSGALEEEAAVLTCGNASDDACD